MIKDIKKCAYVKNGEEYPIDIYGNISSYEKIEFVMAVTDTVVGEDYIHFLKDLIFDFQLVRFFTNIDGELRKTNITITEIEDFFEDNTILDVIKVTVDSSIIDELRKSVDYNIQYKSGIKINQAENSLVEILNVVGEKIKNTNISTLMTEYFKSDDYKKHLKELQAKSASQNKGAIAAISSVKKKGNGGK